MKIKTVLAGLLAIALLGLPFLMRGSMTDIDTVPAGRSEVVFWHFWGGEDREVVDDVVRRFNESQETYFVRSIAMPGNNLQAKLFLSVAGGDPPDLVNQDDPVLSDWAERGVIHAMDEVAPLSEVNDVRNWMLESAEKLSTYNGRMYGVCNGLDIRALYYNKTALDQFGLEPPTTIEQLDEIAATIAPPSSRVHDFYGYLPDSRRLWAWGYVFGGDFYDANSGDVTVDSPEIQNALTWMSGYSRRYGWDRVAAFRKGDQSLPGKTFPLLPVSKDSQMGRYALVMDGQWRVRNIRAFQEQRRAAGLPFPEFGVVPLPVPDSDSDSNARQNAGWVNGNFFVVPSGSKNRAGAWAFAKFWIGYTDPGEAAITCRDGGWIPVSAAVTQHPEFQKYLDSHPIFETFVSLSASPNQFPTPPVVGAAMFQRTVEGAAYEAMSHVERSPHEILKDANQRIQKQLDRVRTPSQRRQSSPERESNAK